MDETIGKTYNLKKDDSKLDTGLIIWYNKVINKTENELSIDDLETLLRQNSLAQPKEQKKLTTMVFNRCIEVFMQDPYTGECAGVTYPGVLLESMVNEWPNVKISKSTKHNLLNTIDTVEKNPDPLKWLDPDNPWDVLIGEDEYYENLKRC